MLNAEDIDPNETARENARRLGCCLDTVRRAARLSNIRLPINYHRGKPVPKWWALIDPSLTAKANAERLGKHPHLVLHAARCLRIKLPGHPRRTHPKTLARLETIKAMRPRATNVEIGAALGISKTRVSVLRNYYGIP